LPPGRAADPRHAACCPKGTLRHPAYPGTASLLLPGAGTLLHMGSSGCCDRRPVTRAAGIGGPRELPCARRDGLEGGSPPPGLRGLAGAPRPVRAAPAQGASPAGGDAGLAGPGHLGAACCMPGCHRGGAAHEFRSTRRLLLTAGTSSGEGIPGMFSWAGCPRVSAPRPPGSLPRRWPSPWGASPALALGAGSNGRR